MTNRPIAQFPGGSKNRVNLAGDRIRNGNAFAEDIQVVNEWREAHRYVINSFQAILRNRTRDRNIIVAQRHKRRQTIVDKLDRFPKMRLSRMDDVAGCRLIFDSIDSLIRFRDEFHRRSRFNHRLRNSPDRYDYISNPKDSGYRGIHDVYEYNVNSEAGRAMKGLLIELQYRTNYQHAWATCVELVGILTENRPKFDQGDDKFLRILRISSEIIARNFEGMKSSLPELSNHEIIEEFESINEDIRFMPLLRRLNQSQQTLKHQNNFLLIFPTGDKQGGDHGELEIEEYRRPLEAFRRLIILEQEHPQWDIVFVRGDGPESVRKAFSNYFSDAAQFISLIEEGFNTLKKMG